MYNILMVDESIAFYDCQILESSPIAMVRRELSIACEEQFSCFVRLKLLQYKLKLS